MDPLTLILIVGAFVVGVALRHMPPRFASGDIAHSRWVDAIRSGDGSQGFASRPSRPNILHVALGQHRVVVGFPASACILALPPLAFHVGHVLGVGAKKEMQRVAAVWIVTIGAIVANLRRRRNWRAVMEFPGDMRCPHQSHGGAMPDNPIALVVRAANPSPAGIRRGEAFYLFPKTIRKWAHSSCVAAFLATKSAFPCLRGDGKGLAAVPASTLGGNMKGHLMNLLQRFEGAIPPAGANSAGGYRCSNYTTWSGKVWRP